MKGTVIKVDLLNGSSSGKYLATNEGDLLSPPQMRHMAGFYEARYVGTRLESFYSIICSRFLCAFLTATQHDM